MQEVVNVKRIIRKHLGKSLKKHFAKSLNRCRKRKTLQQLSDQLLRTISIED